MMWWGGDWSWGAWLAMTVTMFARGEIDEEEFQHRRDLLRSGR
jgi:hypothetical protein